MSTQDSDICAYLRWIIVSDYYDGATAGIGKRTADGAIVWFRVVAWDEEQWRRVFAVTVVDSVRVAQLVRDLEQVEPRNSPYWLPGPASVTPEIKEGWGQILEAATRSDTWWLVEAHDLNELSAERFVAAADVPRVVEGIRAGSVLAVRGASLTDDFLQRIARS